MMRPFTLWIMGPSAGGKTTIARALQDRLQRQGLQCLHFDGDEVRDFFGPDHSFSPEHRLRVVATLGHLANKTVAAGVHCIVSALTANENARDYVNNSVSPLRICYVRCPIEECAKRDPKGLYKKAMEGKIDTLIGYNCEYVEPEHYDVAVDSDKVSVDSAVDTIIRHIYQA